MTFINNHISDNLPDKKLLQAIFDASLSCIFLLKAIRNQRDAIVDFVCLMFNQQAYQSYSATHGVIEAGKTVSDSLPASLKSKIFNRWVHTVETGEAYQVEYGYEQDGCNHWFRERGVKFEDGVIVISEDITAQKEKEETLRRSQTLLLESQELAQLGAFQWNEQMSEAYWTPQMFKILGIEPYSLKITPELVLNVIHPEDRDRFSSAVRQAKTANQPYSVEYRIIAADGSIKYVWAKGKMIDGKLTGTIRDITEEKKKQEEIKKSETLLKQSFEIAHLGGYQWNEAFTDVIWTPQTYDMFGFQQGERITLEKLMAVIHPADKAGVENSIQTAIATQQESDFTYRIIMKDGSLKHIWAKGEFIEGRLTGSVIDLTSRIALEEKNRTLEHRNDDLDNFVYTASHDLAAPVNNIGILLEFLSSEMEVNKDETQSKQYLELLAKAVGQLKATLKDLTKVTEIYQGEAKEYIHLGEIIEEVRISLHEQIQQSNAHIVADLKLSLVNMAKKHLKSLLFNLLSNAIKFRSPHRPLVIHISSYAENNRWHIRFADTGKGIKAEDKPKVYKLFSRFDQAIEGRGIGMYLVKRVIDLNQGNIHIESQIEQGTVFYLDFPILP